MIVLPLTRVACAWRGCLLALLLIPCGCDYRQAFARTRYDLVIGSKGHEPGKFNRPRGIQFDPKKNRFFVIDWDGRIQVFTAEGSLETSWMMPLVKKGKPEDLVLTPRETLLVADTHYSRIVEFDMDGNVLSTFGSYGRDPGQFIYPVGICQDRAEQIYVSEYGENDRIQKFSPDGTFIGQWGSFGEAPGQFQRPSGLSIGPDDTIYVADAVNHRVQVFDSDGNLIRWFGRRGKAPGEFSYPYDVEVRGTFLYVLEYGNQRVQKLQLDGTPVAIFGEGGPGDGQLAAPWRLTSSEESLYISDTYNNRVVKLTF